MIHKKNIALFIGLECLVRSPLLWVLSQYVLLIVVVSERCWRRHDGRRRLMLGTGIALPPKLDAEATLKADDFARLHITSNWLESKDHVIGKNIATSVRVWEAFGL